MNVARRQTLTDDGGECGPCTQRLCATPECDNWFSALSKEQRYCLPCRFARQAAEARG